VVQKLLDDLEIDKKEAAARLGVSVSRVHELTTHNRPNSWLNAERWDDVRARLGA
jgi:plasmid maintenance system antidote protein VapI